MNKLETWAHVALIGLGISALFAVLDVGQNLFAPILLALVVGVVMSPVPDTLDRLGLPKSLAALSSLLIILLVVAALAFFLEPSARRLSSAMPFAIDEMNSLIVELKHQLRGLEDASKDVAQALNDGEAVIEPAAEESAGAALPTVEDALFMAPAVLSQIMIFVGVLFFFMLTRDEVYAWVARRLAPDELRLETAHRLRAAERQVGRYFLTVTVINSVYAVVVAVAMAAIGLPSPILWGIAAGLMNYILYLGPAVMVAAFLLAGLVVFDGAYSMLPAGLYLTINIIEAQFVTPALVGKAMQTNPLLIFLALVFFLWLWGPIGGVIAIPLLLWVLVLSADIKAVRSSLVASKSMEPASS